MVTSLLPSKHGMTGGSIVMHGTLLAAATQARVTLATFATRTDADRESIATLEAAGVEVHPVWLMRQPGERTLFDRSRLAIRWVRNGYPLRSIAFHSVEMQDLITSLETRVAFDLVHVQDNAMGQYRFARDRPSILSELEVRSQPFAPSWANHFAGRPLMRVEDRRWIRYQRDVWNRFARIVVFTKEDRDFITRIQPGLLQRTSVNPFGVDVPPQSLVNHQSANDLLFVGNFLHPPNIDAATWLGREIMPLVRDACPSARLTIAGPHPPAVVREMASDGIAVIGQVDSAEDLIRHATVVLAPVRLGGGMRVKVLQAMAHAKPVVTTPLGAAGIPVTCGETPLAIGADTASFAAATIALLQEPAKRIALGTRARLHVTAHLTWAEHQKRLERDYSEVLKRRPVEGRN